MTHALDVSKFFEEHRTRTQSLFTTYKQFLAAGRSKAGGGESVMYRQPGYVDDYRTSERRQQKIGTISTC